MSDLCFANYLLSNFLETHEGPNGYSCVFSCSKKPSTSLTLLGNRHIIIIIIFVDWSYIGGKCKGLATLLVIYQGPERFERLG